MRALRVLLACCILTNLLLPGHASSGDRQPEYNDCVRACTVKTHSSSLPWHLRMTLWTPLDECRYQCMTMITANAIANQEPIHQYHGKWPFRRVWGIQEPASVIFSILNGIQHWRYFTIIQQTMDRSHPLKRYYLGMAAIAMNAWIWSTVFHTRDYPLTEKLDYFSAGAYILSGLFVAVARIFRLERMLIPWKWFCSALFFAHILYLSSGVRFDYNYNMIVCLVVGVLQTSLWLAWSCFQYTSFGDPGRRSYAWMAGLSVALISAAMVLEIFDFPPWFAVLDAHSLWHAATIPISPLFYSFLLCDAKYDAQAPPHSAVGVQKRAD